MLKSYFSISVYNIHYYNLFNNRHFNIKFCIFEWPKTKKQSLVWMVLLVPMTHTQALYAYTFIENFRKQSNKSVFVGPDSFWLFEQVQIYRICDHFKHVNKCISIPILVNTINNTQSGVPFHFGSQLKYQGTHIFMNWST